jgi:uncharacterized membrane protein YfcA
MIEIKQFIIVLAAFLTSALSACVGIGGGSLLLGLMATLLPISVVIPLHGVAQTFSNFGKAYFGRTQIVWQLTVPFLWGTLIGTAAGLLVWSIIPLNINQMLLAMFLLVSTWKPQWLRLDKMQLWISGAISSVISVFAGATGPIVMAMLPTKTLSKQQTVATHGAIMTLHHSVKTLGFVLIGFSLFDYLPLVIGMLVASWGGSYIGNKVLIKLPESHIKRSIKLILTLLALHLIVKELLMLL